MREKRLTVDAATSSKRGRKGQRPDQSSCRTDPAILRRLAYPRVSNDTPSENAFCCVAPGVRFSDFAILATGVF